MLEGADGIGLYDRLAAVAQAAAVTLERRPELPNQTMMGFYSPDKRQIVVREASPAQMAKTLAHELAHHFGGGTRSSPEEVTMAEAVAYVVCGRFGLDTGERSFPYIATWSQEPKTLVQRHGKVPTWRQ